MFVQIVQGLLEEGGMPKDITTQFTRECPVLSSPVVNRKIMCML
jgi:hypothetical protein